MTDALGIAVSGWALGLFGYVPNVVQTDLARLGIRLFFGPQISKFSVQNVAGGPASAGEPPINRDVRCVSCRKQFNFSQRRKMKSQRALPKFSIRVY